MEDRLALARAKSLETRRRNAAVTKVFNKGFTVPTALAKDLRNFASVATAHPLVLHPTHFFIAHPTGASSPPLMLHPTFASFCRFLVLESSVKHCSESFHHLGGASNGFSLM